MNFTIISPLAFWERGRGEGKYRRIHASELNGVLGGVTEGNETTRLDYLPATSATITITVTSPFTAQSLGGNGGQTLVITGTINSN